METIRPRLIPCQKWAALKSLPYKMVRLDTFALVEISVKERKIFFIRQPSTPLLLTQRINFKTEIC